MRFAIQSADRFIHAGVAFYTPRVDIRLGLMLQCLPSFRPEPGLVRGRRWLFLDNDLPGFSLREDQYIPGIYGKEYANFSR